MKISKTQLTPAKCALDLGDGSERGLYVNQDYILRKLGRPHRGINIMYCYYPFDKEWPQRVSEACKDTNISFAWDYPYDDYFPYRGGIDGNHDGEPFTCMRDIRKHGSSHMESPAWLQRERLHLRMSRLKPLPRTLFLTAA